MDYLQKVSSSLPVYYEKAKKLPPKTKALLFILGIITSLGLYLVLKRNSSPPPASKRKEENNPVNNSTLEGTQTTLTSTIFPPANLQDESTKKEIFAALQKAKAARERSDEILDLLSKKKESFLVQLSKTSPELGNEIEKFFREPPLAEDIRKMFKEKISSFLKETDVAALVDQSIEAAKKSEKENSPEEKRYQEFQKAKMSLKGQDVDWLLSLESDPLFEYASTLATCTFTEFCGYSQSAAEFQEVLASMENFSGGVDPIRKKAIEDFFKECKKLEERLGKEIRDDNSCIQWSVYMQLKHLTEWSVFHTAVFANSVSPEFVKLFLSGDIQSARRELEKIREEEKEEAIEWAKPAGPTPCKKIEFPEVTRLSAEKIRQLYKDKKDFLEMLYDAKEFMPSDRVPREFFAFVHSVITVHHLFRDTIGEEFEYFFSKDYEKLDEYLQVIEQFSQLASDLR